MIVATEFQQRREKLFAQLPIKSLAIFSSGHEQLRKGDSSFPFVPQSDFYYLTGFIEPEAIAVFIRHHDTNEYVLFNREADPIKEVWTGKYVGQERAVTEFGADRAYPITGFEKFLQELLTEYSDYQAYSPQQNDDLTRQLNALLPRWIFKDAMPLVSELRLIKSSAEIALMQKAADISSAAHKKLLSFCKPDCYEYQLEAEFMYACASQGARFQAYPPIVAGGVNACTLHYEHNDQLLRAGELVLVDAGCEYQHYASDITRTYPVSGKFSVEQKAIYELVLNTQIAIIDLIKPGLAFNELQKHTLRYLTTGLVALGLLQGNVEQLIEEKKYLPFYMHSVSHWLGLDVHDAGGYKVNDQPRLLQQGHVLTVEPGIYIAMDNIHVPEKWRGIGIRIEDDVLVTATGSQVLSHVPKKVADIESLMSL